MGTRTWKTAGLLAVAVLLLCGCGLRAIRGSGNVVTEDRDVSGFDRVVLSGFGEVIITQGDEESLTVETDDNLMQYIETEVRGKTLELGFTDDDIFLDPSDSIIFRLSLMDLTELVTSGAGSFDIDELDTDRLELVVTGAGDIQIDSLTATDLAVTVSGAGDIDVAGVVERQEIRLNGLGDYRADDLESQTASVQVNGAGRVRVWVLDTLNVTINGAGDVDYYGSPAVTKSGGGVGSVTSRGDK